MNEQGSKKDICHQQYFRSQTKTALYACIDTSTGYCDDDPNPDPCEHSSMMWVISDDKKTLYLDYYYEVDCRRENFNYRSTGTFFDKCRNYFDHPPCQPDAGYDACSLRFNGTDAGDETCGGCKDCVCFDAVMYSLSPEVPP